MNSPPRSGSSRLQQASRRGLVLDEDVEDLPEQFVRVKRSPDKRALKDALLGDDVHLREEAMAFAHLDPPSMYVRIY